MANKDVKSWNLKEGERIIAKSHHHWNVWGMPLIIYALILILCIILQIVVNKAVSPPNIYDSDYQLYQMGYRHTDFSEYMPYLWLAWAVGAAVSAIGATWNLNKEMIVTNLRFIMKSGLVSTNIKELKLSKVETVDMRKDYFMNSGSVIVHGISTKLRIDGIENPEEFHNCCMKAIENPDTQQSVETCEVSHNPSSQHKNNWKIPMVIIACIVMIAIILLCIGMCSNNETPIATPVADSVTIMVVDDENMIKDSNVNDDVLAVYPSNSKDFEEALISNVWTELTGSGFYVPDFFQDEQENASEDHSYRVLTRSCPNVDISYCGNVGEWDSEEGIEVEFPRVGCLLANNAFVKDITYKSANQGIYSGHTNDGRIFYLKKKIEEDYVTQVATVMRASFVSVIYPKDYQNSITIILDKIKKW